MPWRLILFIAIFAVFLGFVTLNLDNRCNINIGFTQFEGVPIFLTVFITFSMGLLCGAPLVLYFRRRRKGMQRADWNDDYSPPPPSNPEISEKIKQDSASAKERFFLRRRGGKK